MTMPIPLRRGADAPLSQPLSETPGTRILMDADSASITAGCKHSRSAPASCDARAARTDRLQALCLLLALLGPAAFAQLFGEPAYAALEVSPRAKSPVTAPRAPSGDRITPAKSGVPSSNKRSALATVTALPSAPSWRNAQATLPPRAKANDGYGNPRPARAMFPVSLLAKNEPKREDKSEGKAESPATLSHPGTVPLPNRSENALAKPGPRGDASIAALPFVWKGGRASSPLLADARNTQEAPLTNGAASAALPDLSSMGKVVNAAALKLPPASRPLPPQLQAAAVPADTKFISSLPRLAQALPAGATKAPAAPGAANQIEVTVSTFVVLVAPDDLQTVAVADPNIADVVVINSRAVLVNGKAPGATSLVIVDKKIRQYHVQVVPAPGDKPSDLVGSVATAINLPDVQVRAVRGAIVLDGQVTSAEEKRMAEEVAGLYAPKVVNLLQIRPTTTNVGPQVPLDTQIKNAIRNDAVQVRVLGDSVLLEGQVLTEADRAAAEAVAQALAKEMKVVNLLRVPTPATPPPTRLTLQDVIDTLKPQQAPGQPTVVNGVAIPAAPVTDIRVRQVADQIILEGTALTPEEIAQAAAIAARTGLTVVNRISVAKPTPALSDEATLVNTIAASINRQIPGASIMVNGTKERLVLTGTVPSTNQAVLAEQIARGYSRHVDNLMMTPRPQQVDVDISVLEITKSGLKNLGVTFTGLLDSTTSNPTGFVVGQGTPGAVSSLVGDRSIQFLSPLQASIRAEVSRGNARLLSNPRTTVLSGRTAQFKVGGEVPIPGVSTLSGNGNATTSIIFKPFGILLDVTPIASDDGAVTVQVRSEVSQPDFTIGVVPPGGGSAIPGFSQRQAQTEVTVEPGGTLALGGLIQNNIRDVKRELPLLSRIPILGSLFTSKRFQKDETELVILLTPRLLENKLKPGQLAPARPVAVGESTSVPVFMGVPSIPSFVSGNSFAVGGDGQSGAGGAGGGAGQ
jgi:Flp pilus assembly secretin CpaC